MISKRLRSLFGIAFVLTFGAIQAAQATPLNFGFEVEFTLGPLSGQTARGLVAVDSGGCAGDCNGTFTPSDPVASLLAFDITVDGLQFTMGDDINFATGLFPYVTFVDNEISVFDFSGFKTGVAGERQLNLSYALGAGTALFFDPSFLTIEPSFGSLAVTGQIPEPGSLPLLAAALAALGFTAGRPRNAGK